MTDTQDIEAKFWGDLRSDMTMMLGLAGEGQDRTRPMTAQLDSEEDHGPIWFFGAKNSSLAQGLSQSQRAIGSFVSKRHDLFATVQGRLTIDNDRGVIDRLWNPFVAAWYPGGKDDPNLCLLRFDADNAEIWLDGSSFLAGLKMLFGADPKSDYKDNVAKVSLA
jgi:general stress protein 26